ncbi:four helix bundle protein [Maribacter dokdonensis]|uniref:Four helix bundle protein n=2 Tax=Maribacter dokdonensis TaxID=320912 RepID=A0ABY0UDV9_9FLAO|nr:four helix bundle protein [Maribacter dokdonensis]CAG2532271.1 four helix bundle protein [Maribacter dokdonensis]SDS51381.1 four helix bundle protein [Maribacter dokdonensis]
MQNAKCKVHSITWMNNYRELHIWKKGMQLVEEIYFLSKKLPDDEKFGLTSQIKRCSVSIPSNIAEGAGRNSNKEFAHFLSIANGSTTELETQLILTVNLKFLLETDINNALVLCQEIKNMNYALQKSLK